MNRRKFILIVGGAAFAWPGPTQAQQARKVPLVGFLHPGFADTGSPALESLREGLRESSRRHQHIDAQLKKLRASIEAARAATASVPIVANDLESDPVASGYVASLSHPGGNLTGLFLGAPTLCGKWLQQLGEVVPRVIKIAALWDATTGTYQLDAIKAAAKTASIDLSIMEFRDSTGMETALNAGVKQAPQAIVLLGSPLIRQGAPRIVEILSASRVPAISPFRTFPDAGGLMSYGPDLNHLYRSIGAYVSKILHGARPADLPVERPTKFDFVVNLKAAKALGLTMPGSLLAGADEVIE
jgi:ABC-type uncharacterized transport system substrate-binding protein